MVAGIYLPYSAIFDLRRNICRQQHPIGFAVRRNHEFPHCFEDTDPPRYQPRNFRTPPPNLDHLETHPHALQRKHHGVDLPVRPDTHQFPISLAPLMIISFAIWIPPLVKFAFPAPPILPLPL